MKKKHGKKIKKSMVFRELLNKYPELMEILLKKGMHCIGCPAAAEETIEQGAIMHRLNPDKLINELNKEIKKAG